ncbi:hypothetical protein RJ640_022924 [Escallonia rubra]|uniref:Protein kinase domain-containing protein n=1 Tax=Escallonia rubra TaxID=112253 RepID=A0AA88S8T6_9ASTE|nr:hypothetical protein RJ640_022924 [Escallonia rubra]
MGDNKGERENASKKHLTSSPNDPVQESSTEAPQAQEEQQILQSPPAVVVAPQPPFIYSVQGSGSLEQQQQQQVQQFEAAAVSLPKRPRYTAGQWKLLPSPSQQQKQQTQTPAQMNVILSTESSPSATQPAQLTTATAAAASSTDTASSPSQSPRPSSATGQQETDKPEVEQQYHQHQFRKGKYVSPVWKPNEMLWLARAWRVQYQGPTEDGERSGDVAAVQQPPETGRGKTRADKDREVADFLKRHGVNRDAKTAGTKWDNMLGEFRKVYEWERGGEREQLNKSYFRLSPYERKIHRLPASFDEEVFEELSQFMGSRMRSSPSSSHQSVLKGSGGSVAFLSAAAGGDDSAHLTTMAASKSLPPPPPNFRDDDLLPLSARNRQLVLASGVGGEAFMHGARGNLFGFDNSSSFEVSLSRRGLYRGGQDGGETSFSILDNINNAGVGPTSSTSSSHKELRRIGKIRMIWEELVSLWAEEGEHQKGRVKLQGSSFLNADELAFLDDSMVACTMETFEDAGSALKGFSVDRFVSGQQVKVFGRRKSSSSPSVPGFNERVQPPSTEPSIRSIPPWEFQDPTEYYVGCLRVPPPTLPSLFELQWHLQDPPPEELRFPLRKDIYRDLPQGKELFFTTSSELLDCRGITFDILSPIIRPNPSLSSATATSRDSFIGLWDDCINRVVSKFSSVEMVFVRKPSPSSTDTVELEYQWPNLTAFVRNFCLWRGEEADQLREGHPDPSTSIVEKLLWTYSDLPYVLGYFAVGHIVTFCALSRSQDRIIRTDLCMVDLSTPMERLKALIPCWRVAGLLALLADKCFNYINNSCNNFKLLPYSDYERIDLGSGNIIEMTPNTVTRFFSTKKKWVSVKEIYDFLDHRIPHSEFIVRPLEKDLGLVFKPRGWKMKPINCDQLVEALMHVTKALVALHDLSFMHRDLGWDKVMRRSDRENEWFVTGFDEAVGSPQCCPHGGIGAAVGGRHAPEMGRGLHGAKVDVWGVGQLVKTCGLVGLPKMLKELQKMCLDPSPEQRPTAADCYRHLLQLQSSMSAAIGGY